jgi:plastocyanin
VRRALVLAFLALLLLTAPAARAATVTINITASQPDKNPASITAGDTVKWHNNDAVAHTVILQDGRSIPVPALGTSAGDVVEFSEDYIIDVEANGTFSIVATEPTTTTTTTQPTTTTSSSTTTTTSGSSTTSSTSSTTTTTSSSTSTTTTTTTTVFSSASGQVAIKDKGGTSGSSSALPVLLGAFIVVAGLAGLAYWLWLRSGEPYEDDGPDWTQEPPPTVQGPRI